MSQLHSQACPHKTVRCPPDLGLMNPERPAGPSTELYLVSNEYPQCTSPSSRSSPHAQAPRSTSLVLLPLDQMSTSSPQAEKTALGTQHLGNRTCSCSPAPLNTAQGSCPESLPLLYPDSFTPSPSIILPGRISASPLNSLSPSQQHLFPPANPALSSK